MRRETLTGAKGRAWALLLGAQARVIARIESDLAAAGLPPLSWYDVLWALEEAPGGRMRMHELADQVVLSRYNVTRLADRLERHKVIARESCAEDRRGAYCVLTAAGRELRARMWRVYRPAIERYFAAHLSGREAEQIAESLARVVQAARPTPTDNTATAAAPEPTAH